MKTAGILILFVFGFAISLFGQTPEQTQALQTCFAALQQNRETAVGLCTEAVAKAPENNDAVRLRGVANVRAGSFEAAVADFSKAIQLKPNDLDAVMFRGETYQRQSKSTEAIADFSKVLQLQPRSLLALLRRSQSYEFSFRRDLAIADLKAILAIQPNDPTATKALAEAEEKMKPLAFNGRQLTSAEMILQVAGTYLEPASVATFGLSVGVTKDKDYYNLLINCVVRFPESLKCNEKLMEEYNLSKNPLFTETNQKAWVKSNLIFINSNLIQLKPNDAAAFRARGHVHEESKAYELAIADFSKAIANDPKSGSAYQTRGKIYRELKKYDLALADFSKAIELADSFWKYFYLSDRVQLFKLQQNWAGVIADSTQLISIDPKRAGGHSERGFAYLQQKQWSLAVTDLTNAIQILPSFEDLFIQRATAYRGLGKNDLAAADETRAAELKRRRESGGKN